jgi:hypothetical protein
MDLPRRTALRALIALALTAAFYGRPAGHEEAAAVALPQPAQDNT